MYSKASRWTVFGSKKNPCSSKPHFARLHVCTKGIFFKNKIEGTLILKLAMVKRFKILCKPKVKSVEKYSKSIRNVFEMYSKRIQNVFENYLKTIRNYSQTIFEKYLKSIRKVFEKYSKSISKYSKRIQKSIPKVF